LELTDPLAAAETIGASRSVHLPLLLSILVPVLVTLLLGRVFCSWMCPAGLLFELTHKLRALLRFAEVPPAEVRFSHGNKYLLLAVGLLLAAVLGMPFFSLVYPPAVVSRVVHAWIFGTAFSGMLLLLGAMVAVEVLVSPRLWCRTLCPGGALYGILGSLRRFRVRLVPSRCTACRECEPACPMGLNPVRQSASIECDNCLACLAHCPEDALKLRGAVRPERRRVRGRAPALGRISMALVAFLALSGSAVGHHILGLPHYSYKENYPQVPTLEYPAVTGPWDVLMTSYPGRPAPGEPANLAFYVKHRESGAPYSRAVSIRVLQTFTFGENREVVAATAVPPFDHTHKLSVNFPEDGEFVVELTLDVEGRDEVIPFLMIVGEPSAAASVLVAAGAGLLLFVVAVRAIKIKRNRRRAILQGTG
jgi:ferredoxin-type protein NapH